MITTHRPALMVSAALLLAACSAGVGPLDPVGGEDTPDTSADGGPGPTHDAGVDAPRPLEPIDLGDARTTFLVGFSADGSRVAFVVTSGGVLRGELRVADVQTHDVRTLDTDVVVEMPRIDAAMSPLSDGVLYRKSTGSSGDVWRALEASDLYFVGWDGAPERLGTATQRNAFRFVDGGHQIAHLDGSSATLVLHDRRTGRDRTLADGVDHGRHAPADHALALVDGGRTLAYTVRGELRLFDLGRGAPLPASEIARTRAERVWLDGPRLVAVTEGALQAAVVRDRSTGAELRTPEGERVLVAPDTGWALVVGPRDERRTQSLTLVDLRSGERTSLGDRVDVDVALDADGEALVLDGPIPAARRLARLDRAARALVEVDTHVYGLGGFDLIARARGHLAYVRAGDSIPSTGDLVVYDLEARTHAVVPGPDGPARARPGTLRFVDGGRALVWLEDLPTVTVRRHVLASQTTTTVDTTGLVPLPDDGRALLERTDGIDVVRWGDLSRRVVRTGECHVEAASEALVALNVRAGADAWRLVVHAL